MRNGTMEGPSLREGELKALDGAIKNLGPFGLDTVGKFGTLDDAMGKFGPLNDLMGNWGSVPRILFKQVNTVPKHTFKLLGPNFD